MLCTKWAHLKFDACYRSQNSWDGACLSWCGISSSFKNCLKMSGHWGYEFLDFWCWNLVTFLPNLGFQLLKSLLSSLMYFSFNYAPNHSIGDRSGLQGGQFSIRALLLQSHAVVIAAGCGFALSCWNTCRLEERICCSKPLYTFQHS